MTSKEVSILNYYDKHFGVNDIFCSNLNDKTFTIIKWFTFLNAQMICINHNRQNLKLYIFRRCDTSIYHNL